MFNIGHLRNNDTVLFYPKYPLRYHSITRVLPVVGMWSTNKIHGSKHQYNMIFKWHDRTIKPNRPELIKLHKKHPIINFNCVDISKSNVNKCFKKIFGYDQEIDPLRYNGLAVIKSDKNFTHDGKIIECPINYLIDKKGMVYQKYIDTFRDDHFVDMRIPIFGKNIPYILLNHRLPEFQFGVTMDKIDLIINPRDIISDDEYNKIISFCTEMGIDYGELDILRDIHTDKLYIVDANDTPAGPLAKLSGDQFKLVMKKSFYAFLPMILKYKYKR